MIRIMSTQIPKFWEVIKFSALTSDQIAEKDQEVYCNNLLINLLSGKKQCYIVKDEGKIAGVGILSFFKDSNLDSLGMHLSNIYAFTPKAGRFFNEVRRDLLKLANELGCKSITGESPSPAIAKLVEKAPEFSGVRISTKFTYYL